MTHHWDSTEQIIERCKIKGVSRAMEALAGIVMVAYAALAITGAVALSFYIIGTTADWWRYERWVPSVTQENANE